LPEQYLIIKIIDHNLKIAYNQIQLDIGFFQIDPAIAFIDLIIT